MATNIVTDINNQANAERAADELAALPSYAASPHHDGAAVLARALELTKAFLPAEVQYSIDAILDAQAMACSGWCGSAKEVA
jgi:hypothetical protein